MALAVLARPFSHEALQRVEFYNFQYLSAVHLDSWFHSVLLDHREMNAAFHSLPLLYPLLLLFSCSVVSNCNSMNCSMPGFPVLHHLPEFAQTHVHWAGDAIQPSNPLSSPTPFAFNLSQHQGLFQWVSTSHQVVKVLELQLQNHSFQWIFWTDLLRLTGLILEYKGLSKVFSNTTIQKH